MPDNRIEGTWPDKRAGVRHGASGRLLSISAPSRWDTRTWCGQRVYDCPDTSEDDVITCIACLGRKVKYVSLQGLEAEIRGLKADHYIIDEAKFLDISTVMTPADPQDPSGSC